MGRYLQEGTYTKNSDIDVTATDHGEGFARVEDGGTREKGDSLFAGVDQVTGQR